MQELRKPRQGYKFVKSMFGKYQEIPDDWEIIKLINLCKSKPKYGAAASALPKDDHLPRYIRITDLNDEGTLRKDQWASISEENANSYLLSEGDIVFARTGATVGKTYLYNKEDGKCAFAGYLIRFIPNEKKLNTLFLFYYTHSYHYWRWLRSIQTEGVQPNVNAEQYSHLPVTTPLITQQQKIASILSNVDSLIQQTQKIIEQTQRLKKGLMQKLLTKGIGHTKFKKIKWHYGKMKEIPEDWSIVPLGKLCKIRKDGEIQSNLYVGLEHIGQGNNMLESIGDVKEFTSTKNIFLKGDILYGKLRPLLNKVWLAESSGYCSIDILPLIVTDNIIDKMLLLILSYHDFYWYAVGTSAGTKMPRTNWSDMKKFLIALPKIPEQKKIIHIFFNIDSKINKLESQKSQYETLKKGLMQKLLTGKMCVKV